jgi:hypothetical protein
MGPAFLISSEISIEFAKGVFAAGEIAAGAIVSGGA